MGGHIDCGDVAGQAKITGKSANKGLVGVGVFASELMVDVSQTQLPSVGRRQRVQDVRQRDRIGAPGDSDENPRASGRDAGRDGADDGVIQKATVRG